MAHAEAAEPESPGSELNLFSPCPECPQCGRSLGFIEQLPVIGWVLAGGHCKSCGGRISGLYPVVEAAAIAAGPLVVAMALRQPVASVGWADLGGMVLSIAGIFLLLALLLQDALHGLAVDRLTFPLLWLGLLGSAGGLGRIDPSDAILGAAAGWMLLRSGYWLATRRHGSAAATGWGDMKMAAAIGAILGPLAVLVALVVATGVSILLMGRIAFRQAGLTGTITAEDQPTLRFAPILTPLAIALLLVPQGTLEEWLLPALKAFSL